MNVSSRCHSTVSVNSLGQDLYSKISTALFHSYRACHEKPGTHVSILRY